VEGKLQSQAKQFWEYVASLAREILIASSLRLMVSIPNKLWKIKNKKKINVTNF
jgi:hypothetical protein